MLVLKLAGGHGGHWQESTATDAHLRGVEDPETSIGVLGARYT